MSTFFTTLLRDTEEFKRVLSLYNGGRLPVGITGLSSVAKAHFVHAVRECTGKRGLLVTHDDYSARRLCDDLSAMGSTALHYPMRDFVFRNTSAASSELTQMRLSVLSRFMSGECDIIVASAEAALSYTIPPETLQESTITLSKSDNMPLDKLIKKLIFAGYLSRHQVDAPCQFSKRGGIIDIFPPNMDMPVRIEFWGDSVDSLSTFELLSQRRVEPIDSVTIPPGGEVLFGAIEDVCGKIEAFAHGLSDKDEHAKTLILNDAERLRAEGGISNIDKYISLIYDKPASLLDYARGGILFLSETASIRESLAAIERTGAEDIAAYMEEGVLAKELTKYSADSSDLWAASDKGIVLENFNRTLKLGGHVEMSVSSMSVWNGQLGLLAGDLRELLARKRRCIILAGTKRAALSLVSSLKDEGLSPYYFGESSAAHYKNVKEMPALIVAEGALTEGFEYPSADLTIFSYGVTVSYNRRTAPKRNHKEGKALGSLSDLDVGDLVVHISHGIGIFEGVEQISLNGVVKDYLKIKYHGTDVLFVPVNQLDMVTKHIGGDAEHVKLSRLNSVEWTKTKLRVKTAARDMAKELLVIYAKREEAKGFTFSSDSEWQKNFEERFPHTETDDQLRCVDEIKKDMERHRPMDRLLCGDVGFGKTEVALRAVFKATMDSKQSAILVPTTILALQHYKTASGRFDGFPINIEMLSRFRNAKEQSDIKKKLKTGEIDVLIGTHRMLGKDIDFKSLGLVIVDEEQRFGVAHKEKLKDKFPHVDVLTLSATPIPRTLNMAMSGIRDMSTIEEPPQNRQPIQSYVIEHNLGVITEAIKREVRRGGQVYYLHNKIETIDKTAAELMERMPNLRFETAHGSMSETQLSSVWERLLGGKIDVLICTTIIETGVDVSNVNTLIIEDADKFGLSQLYQLRGRIGRGARRAYAYFTFRKGKAISEIATKRLTAIREFTKFGSGFSIAMRDLEIRGAGNILGAQQHGHMEAVGYYLYLKLLGDAVNELKGERPAESENECLVDLNADAYISEEYISDMRQRLSMYKRIAAIESESDKLDVIDELIDRYGEPPAAVLGLITVALLRSLAKRAGIKEISQKADSLLFYADNLDMEMWGRAMDAFRGRIFINASANPYVAVRIPAGSDAVSVMSETVKMLSPAQNQDV